ncbi:hypothetical protein KQX54_011401 [Cotesia glomerata]|uniref:Uncharacterized protein n=1 Tax=Cotesia glomerata TaxID=32391 RepID=A0AAV7I8P1_COTGL|nr:hypothetical protein KQX54_011401 [Cotesia glomerata]
MFKRDETPRHVAITKGNTEAVGLLIQHGAKNMAELSLKNCIHESIKFHNKSSNENETTTARIESVTTDNRFWLITWKIRWKNQNHFNEDEYVYVQYGGVLGTSNHFTVSEQMPLEYYLERFNNSVVAKGYENSRNGNKVMLEILLKEGADVQARDEKDETPLHVAITKENTETVGLLIQHGADVHSVSPKWKTGFTSLHQAIVNNKKDIVNILISGGADINSDA